MRSDLFVGSTTSRCSQLVLGLAVLAVLSGGVAVSSSIGENAVAVVRRFVIRNYRRRSTAEVRRRLVREGGDRRIGIGLMLFTRRGDASNERVMSR